MGLPREAGRRSPRVTSNAYGAVSYPIGARRPQCCQRPWSSHVDRSQLDAAITEVERAGGGLVSRGEPAPGIPYAYVADREGYVIELAVVECWGYHSEVARVFCPRV